MNKVTVLILGIVLLTSGSAFAQQNIPQLQQARDVDVGNKTCPISGRQIGQMGPPYKEEYKGKIYNLCCGGCQSTFESDPEKYSKIAQDDAAQNGQYKDSNQ
jgi:YHS domain-containing protein